MATTQPGWGLGLLGVATLELVPAPSPNPQCCQLLISGLRAQDDSAKSLVKEVVLSVEIAKYYFKEATEQRLCNQERSLESWPGNMPAGFVTSTSPFPGSRSSYLQYREENLPKHLRS